jgi:hypothetical protein
MDAGSLWRSIGAFVGGVSYSAAPVGPSSIFLLIVVAVLWTVVVLLVGIVIGVSCSNPDVRSCCCTVIGLVAKAVLQQQQAQTTFVSPVPQLVLDGTATQVVLASSTAGNVSSGSGSGRHPATSGGQYPVVGSSTAVDDSYKRDREGDVRRRPQGYGR